MSLLGAITWIKGAWTAAATLGTCVTFVLLSMAITDYKLLIKQGINSWRQYVARTSILIFLGGLITQLVYFTAGIVSITQPNPYNRVTTAQIISGSLFIFGALTSITLAIVIFYRRKSILEVIEDALSNKEKIDDNGDG